MVMTPAMTQARTSQPGVPISRVDSAEVMKMPEPIIEPITIMVASSGPSPRTSFSLGVFIGSQASSLTRQTGILPVGSSGRSRQAGSPSAESGRMPDFRVA